MKTSIKVTDITKGPKTMVNQHCFNIIKAHKHWAKTLFSKWNKKIVLKLGLKKKERKKKKKKKPKTHWAPKKKKKDK